MKINGIYIFEGKVIGKVEDFDPKEWFGKVTLNGMEEFAEYGTLEMETSVIGDDGKTYTYSIRDSKTFSFPTTKKYWREWGLDWRFKKELGWMGFW